MNFVKVSESTFNELVLEAGVILNTFNPSQVSAPADSAIVCATTGGINVTCIPTFTDMGEDMDNVMNNSMELKHIDSYDCKFGFTALNVTAEAFKLAIGAADISGNKITPRKDLKLTDFKDEIWWVGDVSDGGMVAVCLKNVLSTGGFSLQTTKNGKGQIQFELTGHVSLSAQDEIPMEFYIAKGTQS